MAIPARNRFRIRGYTLRELARPAKIQDLQITQPLEDILLFGPLQRKYNFAALPKNRFDPIKHPHHYVPPVPNVVALDVSHNQVFVVFEV